MSEVIEEFIRTHSNLQEREAFETFLRQDRIKTWVGQDPARRDRLQREFSRVWGDLRAGAAPPQASVAAVARPAPHPHPPPPAPQQPRESHAPLPRPREAPPQNAPAPREHAPREPPSPREPAPAPRAPTRVEVRQPPAAQARHAPSGSRAASGTRRLNLLCPACGRLDVWLQDGAISCHGCGRAYDDMLALVPVKPVGPFEYVFGEGVVGYLKAAGVGTLLLLVYGVLKWL